MPGHWVWTRSTDRGVWMGYTMDMTSTTRIIQEALNLSPSERMDVIERLWASVEAESTSLELTDAQRQELDRRIAEMDANPNAGIPWGEVKKSLMI